MTEYNNRIEIDFTDKNGKHHKDVYGIKQQACAYARLLSELGYHVNSVFDVYGNEQLDWGQKNDDS